MDKQAIYTYLRQRGIRHEITEHAAVYTMGELADIDLPYPYADAKNLFVRDDKKQAYYLITVKGDKRVDLKAFRRTQGTRPLTFASPEDLHALLGLIPGAVTPLGALNDTAHRVTVCVDRDFWQGEGIIGVHPNDNTATVWLAAADLVAILRDHGCEVRTVEV